MALNVLTESLNNTKLKPSTNNAVPPLPLSMWHNPLVAVPKHGSLDPWHQMGPNMTRMGWLLFQGCSVKLTFGGDFIVQTPQPLSPLHIIHLPNMHPRTPGTKNRTKQWQKQTDPNQNARHGRLFSCWSPRFLWEFHGTVSNAMFMQNILVVHAETFGQNIFVVHGEHRWATSYLPMLTLHRGHCEAVY